MQYTLTPAHLLVLASVLLTTRAYLSQAAEDSILRKILQSYESSGGKWLSPRSPSRYAGMWNKRGNIEALNLDRE